MIMKTEKYLSALKPGEIGRVKQLGKAGDIRRRLLDIGLIEHTKVECVGKSPGGDPSAYLIRGAVIAIRSEDGRHIIVETIEDLQGDVYGERTAYM